MVCKSPLLHGQNAKDGKVFNKQVASVRKTFFFRRQEWFKYSAISRFYRTQRLIIMSTRAPVHPQTMSLKCILTLPSYLCIGRPDAQLPSGFSITFFYPFFIFFLSL